MKSWTSALGRFASDEYGVTQTEYALLASLIAIACAVTLLAMGANVNSLFVRVCNEVTKAVTGAPAC